MLTLEHGKYAGTISCPQAATLLPVFRVEMGIVY
jgi:hypothetical protein